MLTPIIKKKKNLFQNQQVNTKTLPRQYEQSKKSAIYDICCPQGSSSSTGISKLCFMRCYSEGMKADMKDIENYDFLMPPGSGNYLGSTIHQDI